MSAPIRNVLINGIIITQCKDCPMNISQPNPIMRFLPKVHKCKVMFDVNSPDGKLLFNPNIIPTWCPYA